MARERHNNEIQNKVIDEVVQAELQTLAFKTGSIDAVIYNHVLHNLVQPEYGMD